MCCVWHISSDVEEPAWNDCLPCNLTHVAEVFPDSMEVVLGSKCLMVEQWDQKRRPVVLGSTVELFGLNNLITSPFWRMFRTNGGTGKTTTMG